MGYVAHVSKTFPVRTYVPVSAGKTECTTKFFGGQTVEVGNYGQTPLRAYKD
ncbi:hypothetical protein [Allosalinactinospora lopnorensis]|uniref:hypothetical protein n=1 Tax=Allosalinactinospora lopnorensis TaxID=1352348 RepID=UPI0012E1BCE9|nr:hypothetical protein [Allosalinactinospora lopnorensis]